MATITAMTVMTRRLTRSVVAQTAAHDVIPTRALGMMMNTAPLRSMMILTVTTIPMNRTSPNEKVGEVSSVVENNPPGVGTVMVTVSAIGGCVGV